jgi:tetratricopeptide (TPR) repeat protein
VTSEQPLLGWDPALAERLADIDPHLLGRRLRAARVAAGLTQAEAGGEELSTAYVSRIEAGARRPSARALQSLARQVGLPPADLLRAAEDDPALTGVRLTLDYAELALETGEAAEAETQTRGVLDELPEDSPLRERALFLRGRALEAVGRLVDAVTVLRPIAAGEGVFALRATIALCRCLREAGELDRAVEEGEAALDRLKHGHWPGSDESVQLVATVASCHYENGDVSRAARLCRDAVTAAEQLGSPAARAAAYWNASRVESERGNVAAALPLAGRALALLGEGRDARNLARLRGQFGILLLSDTPPAVEEALQVLHQAEDELRGSSAGRVDVARISAALARALMLDGQLSEATDRALRALGDVQDQSPRVAADARAVLGHIAARQGDVARAQELFAEAARLLTSAGADRSTAQLWYELASGLETVGAVDQALDAYRRAAAASGLTPAPTESPATLRAGAR